MNKSMMIMNHIIMMKIMSIKNKLIENGVKNLKEFGYPHVNKENILTDEIYSAFFLGMLEDNEGIRDDIDEAIAELKRQIGKKDE